jgi:protein-L-isoaspartate(D-aspartate) O-methyltransferase
MGDKELMLDAVYENNEHFGKRALGNVIKAMKIIDREFFVPDAMNSCCYDDTPLQIGHGQTISQPSTVAAMVLYLELKPGLDVLEVGAGSGWNACIIQYLVHPGSVVAVERISSLAKKANDNLADLKRYLQRENPKEVVKLSKPIIKSGDALDEKSGIWSKKYDRVIVTAGIPFDVDIERVMQRMADNLLKRHGILICPQVSGPLKIYKKNKELKLEETREEYVFVPLLKGME